jgi:hypothetical protein
MISVVSQGDQACTVTTEHSLAADTKGGVYALVVDLSPMAGGDTVEIRLKSKTRDTGVGSTARTIKYATYSGAQTDPTDKDLGPIACDLYCEATIKQTAGTGRTIPWKLIRIA